MNQQRNFSFFIKFLFAFVLGFCANLHNQNIVVAQTTNFDQVVDILKTNGCTSAGCHVKSSTNSLKLDGTVDEVYKALIDITPNNTTAANKGDKLIKPGHPYNSFLLRKINNGLIHALDASLDDTEGSMMPPKDILPNAIDNIELEFIRQWIIAGAPKTGSPVNLNLIETYYTEGGVTPVERPEPPKAGQGFQLHFGPIFIAPDSEAEYLIKNEIQLNATTEVKRLNVAMNDFSHHFILYKFADGKASKYKQGLREVTLGSNAFGNEHELVAVWQYNDDINLPAGTAFSWPQNTVLDLNSHIRNYSTTQVLPVDVYVNIHTQPSGTALRQMKSDLLIYDPFSLIIPPGETSFSGNINNAQDWNIWLLSSHTHKYGTDFDIFRNKNSKKGEQLYEGFYDCKNDLNFGSYNWDEPPTCYNEPYINLKKNEGLIQEAKFDNTSSKIVTFGLTTNDEMMISIIQYYEGEPLPFVGIPKLRKTYCVTEGEIALNLQPAGGILAINGAEITNFNPSKIGEGIHNLTYTAEGLTAEYEILITSAPDLQIAISHTGQTLECATGFDNYQWYKNGIALKDYNSPIFTPTGNGVYTVAAWMGYCQYTSEPFEVNFVGINPVLPSNTATAVSVQPNPFNNTFTIFVNNAISNNENNITQINLYNAVGQLVQVPFVLNNQFNDKIITATVNTTAQPLPAGLYYVQVISGQHITTQKIIKAF